MEKELSITQELVLLLLAAKKNLNSTLNLRRTSAIVSAGLLELIQAGVIELEPGKQGLYYGSSRIRFLSELPDDLAHLSGLVELIKNSGTNLLRDVVYKNFYDIYYRKLKPYLDVVVKSLVDAGVVTFTKQRVLFINIRKTIVDPNTEDLVVQNLRANLLESGEAEAESVILALLLEKADLLKRYFSTHEQAQLQARLQQIKQSPADQDLLSLVEQVQRLLTLFATPV